MKMDEMSHTEEVANEDAAELYADDWVLKNEYEQGISN